VASTQWIDAFPGKLGPHLDRLAELLAEEEDVVPEPVRASPRVERKRPGWIIPAGAAAASLLVVVLAAAFWNAGDRSLNQDFSGANQQATAVQTQEGAQPDWMQDADYRTCDSGSGAPAIAACDRALGSGKYSGRLLSFLYNDRGYLRMMSGDLDGGLADLNEAIRVDPYHPYPYWNRAELYRHKGDVANAKADFERALSLGPRPEDRPKIEAGMRALELTTPQTSDPFVINDPAQFGGGQEGNASAAESYPAETYPAEAAPPITNGAPTNGAAPSMDAVPNSSYDPMQ